MQKRWETEKPIKKIQAGSGEMCPQALKKVFWKRRQKKHFFPQSLNSFFLDLHIFTNGCAGSLYTQTSSMRLLQHPSQRSREMSGRSVAHVSTHGGLSQAEVPSVVCLLPTGACWFQTRPPRGYWCAYWGVVQAVRRRRKQMVPMGRWTSKLPGVYSRQVLPPSFLITTAISGVGWSGFSWVHFINKETEVLSGLYGKSEPGAGCEPRSAGDSMRTPCISKGAGPPTTLNRLFSKS